VPEGITREHRLSAYRFDFDGKVIALVIGNVFGGEQAREMLPRVAANVAYGPDSRQIFDIRRATSRRADSPVPVVIFIQQVPASR
jgi:hypothetical protein